MGDIKGAGDAMMVAVPAKRRDVTDKENDVNDDVTKERDTWSGKLDFVLSALSFAVGMGNLWRFPYLCYRSGGGAFLIPYVISMILAGYPLMFLELALGQFIRKGIVPVWQCCPLFEGIGWGMLSVSLFTGIYYNMIVAWCMYYMFSCFASDVPWRNCGNAWNTEACTTAEMIAWERNCTGYNGTWFNETCVQEREVDDALYRHIVNTTSSANITRRTPSDEFFNKYILDASDGFHDMGAPRWQLVLCLLFCWVIVIGALAKGVKVSGKVTYVTALLPYVVLLILLCRALTLEGSLDGILFYVTPQWDKLLSARVWGDAVVQAFFSLSLCWGGLISLSSFNRFNNNCLRDAIIIATGDMMTSIFGGFVIFAVIGYMAHTIGVEVDEVATQGPGLAFVVYPEAVTMLPFSPLWAILFMLMLINIGLGSQMGLVSTVHTTLTDVFAATLGRGRRPLYLLITIGVVGFLLGLSLTTRGGVYMLIMMDTYSATYALLILAFGECIAIGWIYGAARFSDDIAQMVGFKINIWWTICWKFVNPILILFIICFIAVDFDRSSYGDYVFPVIYDVMGWSIAIISMMCIPLVGAYKVITAGKELPLIQRIRRLCYPTADWAPAVERPLAVKVAEESAREPLREAKV